jgi:hypothetical protein
MTRTRRKLNEAHFFLGRLEQNQDEETECDYYLSAFISSARSVLWIMRSEYESIGGWEDWYTSKMPDEDGQSFLKKINSIRVRSEKAVPLETSFLIVLLTSQMEMTPELKATLEYFKDRDVTCTIDSSNERLRAKIDDGHRVFEADAKVVQALDEFPDEDIVDVCKKYHSLLEQMVSECESVFQSPEPKAES